MSQKGYFDPSESQFERGSDNRVLKNLPGIKKITFMDQLEAVALKQTEMAVLNTFGAEHRFTADDICSIHKTWLGNIYSWAGNYRRVDLGKSSISHTTWQKVPGLMEELEKNALARLTPCRFQEKEKAVSAVAEVHAELVRIHPFRLGNKRLARLIATVMALQAGFPPLDFSDIRKEKKEEFDKAMRSGTGGNYKPTEKIFAEVFERTIARQGSK